MWRNTFKVAKRCIAYIYLPLLFFFEGMLYLELQPPLHTVAVSQLQSLTDAIGLERSKIVHLAPFHDSSTSPTEQGLFPRKLLVGVCRILLIFLSCPPPDYHFFRALGLHIGHTELKSEVSSFIDSQPPNFWTLELSA